MPYGSNGYNTDGSSMNVNNVMGETRSIKLLGRQKGYDTGHAMAALLGIRSLTADEEEHQRADQHRERMQRGGGGSNSGASTTAGSARRPNSHASHHEPHAQRTPPQPHHHHHQNAAASARHQPHPHPHHHHRRAPQQQASPLSAAVSPQQQQQPGLRVGMKIITTKPIELHSGNSLPAGVVGTVCKVPGDLAGTVAEVDIPDGPLFDAWPGTIASLDDEEGSSAGCRKCGSNLAAAAKFCQQCGTSMYA